MKRAERAGRWLMRALAQFGMAVAIVALLFGCWAAFGV